MQKFIKSTDLPVPAEIAFSYHESQGALTRLIPTWEKAKVIRSDHSLRPGSKVVIEMRKFGLPMRWHAKHIDYDPPHQFSDLSEKGPFKSWMHRHEFVSDGETNSTLTDRIEYEIPLGFLGRTLLGKTVRRDIDAMFDYRHDTTLSDLSLKNRLGSIGRKRIAITGSTGMVGSRLISLLSVLGHETHRLVRPNSRSAKVLRNSDTESDRLIDWDPITGMVNPEKLNGFDAVIHLAGANVAGGRWIKQRKETLVNSRVPVTHRLAEQLADLSNPPAAFITASGIGIFGDRGDEALTEQSEIGDDFLADMARRWESATKPAEDAGIRTAQLRFGAILHPQMGALGKMTPLFKLGLGGRLGSGKQYFSWIDIDDAAGALVWLAMKQECSGAFNGVAPNPVTNAEFTKTMGRVLSRPTILPAPAFALRTALGEMADAILLSGQRAYPNKLNDSGYVFRYEQLEPTLRRLFGRMK